MGRFAKQPDESDYPRVPVGTHLGICYRIIDLGTHHDEYEGKKTVRNRVLISWEIPAELMEDGRPFSISEFYTNSLGERAKLRAHLSAWRGRDFTKDELARFDLVNILDKPALINVGRSEKGREKVVSVVAIPKGTVVPTRFNPLQTFFIDEWDDAIFSQIPEGIQKIIKQSDEYKALKNGGNSESDPDDNLGPDSDEDRPPF